MKRVQRGSIAVFAMVMIVSTAALAIVMISLSGALRTKQGRLEDNRVVAAAFDGGVDLIRDMASRGVLRPPQTVSTTINNVGLSLAVSDVTGANISLLGVSVTTSAPTLLVSGTLTFQGGAYRLQRVIGRGLISTVWQYAIYDDSALNSSFSTINTGSSGKEGDAWFGGNLSLPLFGNHIRGDLTAVGTIWPFTLSVDGKTTSMASSITFPTTSDGTYKSAAGTVLAGNSTIDGYSFLSADASGYPIIFIDGNGTVKGSFTGSGVIYVKGMLTISGNVTCGASDHIVLMGSTGVTMSSSASSVDAYIYSGKVFTISNSGVNRNLLRGVVASSLSLGDSATFSFDPWVRDHPVEAYMLHLPGSWP